MTHLIHRHPLLHLKPTTEMNPLTTPHPMTNRTRPRTVAPNDQLDNHDRCNWLFDIQKIYLEPVGFEPHKTMSRLHYRQPISGKSSIHLFSMQPVRASSFDPSFSHVVLPSHGSLFLFLFLVVTCDSYVQSCQLIHRVTHLVKCSDQPLFSCE